MNTITTNVLSTVLKTATTGSELSYNGNSFTVQWNLVDLSIDLVGCYFPIVHSTVAELNEQLDRIDFRVTDLSIGLQLYIVGNTESNLDLLHNMAFTTFEYDNTYYAYRSLDRKMIAQFKSLLHTYTM